MHHDIQTILDKIMNAFQAQIQEFSPRLIDNLKKKREKNERSFFAVVELQTIFLLWNISLFTFTFVFYRRGGVGGGIISNDL